MTSESCIRGRVWIPAVIVASLGLTAGRAAAAQIDQGFAAAGIARIVVDLPLADDLTLEGKSGDVRVTASGHDDAECRVTVARDGDTVRVSGVHHHVVHDYEDCDLVVHVTVPASAAVNVDLGAGAVQLVTLASPLELTLGAGDIKGSISATATVKTGAGRIRLRDLTGPVEVKTGVGEIELAFATAPAGSVHASSGMGTIDLEFPAGTAVDASLGTGLGSVTNSVPQRDGAATRVRASTGMGAIVLSSR